jgi:hypothetical protein
MMMMNEIQLNDLQKSIIARIIRQDEVISARCGWGSGKTSALVFSLLTISKWRRGCSSLLITDTTPRYNSVLMPEISKWLEPLGWVYNHTLRLWTDTHTGSTVWCRSYFRPGTREATHNPLEGLNITSGVCLIDECQTLTAEVAHKALGRLRAGPSPIMILVGLPVADAWWCSMAEEAGYTPLLFTSYVNQANLSEAWFEATKLLPEAEREAMVMNKPAPPTGLIYNEFTANHVIKQWQYNESMTGRIAIDWGFRKPSVLIMAHDEKLNATVICHEINPAEVTTSQLAEMILRIAWPRALKEQAPGPRIWLDDGVADKAGRARNDQTGQSAFRAMRKPPSAGGIGMHLRNTSDPIRVDVLNGIQRLKRAFNSKRYLITAEVWDKGERARGNSIRKALLSYSWDNKEQPKKDGREDPLDALRYDCIMFNWHDLQVDQRQYTTRASGGSGGINRRKVRVGGGSTRSF